MESRLKKSHARMSISQAPGAFSTKAASSTPTAQEQKQQEEAAANKDEANKARSRPGTARATQQAPSSGNMPPTPGGSEGEYYLVTKADLDDNPR